MNQKARKLQEQIVKRESLRNNLVKSQKKQLEDFDNETTRLQNRLELTIQSCSPQIKAAEAYCRITNSLIKKYKELTETDPKRALKELTKLEGVLLIGGYITEQELKEAL